MANALVETATFVAILFGTIAAGSLLSQEVSGPVIYVVCGFGLIVALLGIFSSLKIPATPSVTPDLQINWNVFSTSWRNVKQIKSIKLVWPCLLGISWLWFVGATFLTQFPLLTKSVLHASPAVATFLLFLFTLGLGAGAFLCEKWSNKRIEMGLIPLGLIIMVVSGAVLHLLLTGYQRPSLPVGLEEFLSLTHSWLLIATFLSLSAGVGLYSVPLYASIQALAPVELRSRTIAANNILNSFFMVASAGIAIVVLGLTQGNVIWVFFLVTVLTFVVLLLWLFTQPHVLLRFVALFKVNKEDVLHGEGSDQLKGQDPALIVFPSLLHEQTMQRLVCLPIPFTVVLSGKMKSSIGSRWLLKHGFVLDLSGLKDYEGQKALLTHIAKAMTERRIVAIDRAMYRLLIQRFELNKLPATLAQKEIQMQIFEFIQETTQIDGSSGENWSLTLKG